MKRVSATKWNQYTSIAQDFIENDAGQKPIKWIKYITSLPLYAEDGDSKYESKELNVLISYNEYRTWPINSSTVSGEIDRESANLIISKRYLTSLGLLNSSGYIDLDISRDRFIIDGKVYAASGDTASSQASNNEVSVMIIIKRVGNEKESDFPIYQTP